MAPIKQERASSPPNISTFRLELTDEFPGPAILWSPEIDNKIEEWQYSGVPVAEIWNRFSAHVLYRIGGLTPRYMCRDVEILIRINFMKDWYAPLKCAMSASLRPRMLYED